MRTFYRYYLITTQIIAFMVVPPLLAYIICKRINTTYNTLVIRVVLSLIAGIIMAVLFALKVFLKIEKKEEGINNKNE